MLPTVPVWPSVKLLEAWCLHQAIYCILQGKRKFVLIHTSLRLRLCLSTNSICRGNKLAAADPPATAEALPPGRNGSDMAVHVIHSFSISLMVVEVTCCVVSSVFGYLKGITYTSQIQDEVGQDIPTGLVISPGRNKVVPSTGRGREWAWRGWWISVGKMACRAVGGMVLRCHRKWQWHGMPPFQQKEKQAE